MRERSASREGGTTPAPDRDASTEAYHYPEGRVAGVIDTPEQLAGALAALTGGGFAEPEIVVVSGPAAADAMHASTGRTGLRNLVVRVAERLGVADEEMELKARYEAALRDGRFVVSVPAPGEEQGQRAAQVLRAHGGHAARLMGRFSIHGIVPPPAAP